MRESTPELPPRQRDVLNFIASTVAHQGVPPTYREIGDALGIGSTNGVADHVKALVRKGYLAKVNKGAARGIQLTQKAGVEERNATISVPIVGTVAAGAPLLAQENYENTVHLDSSLVSSQAKVFALRVKGDSMIEEGIHDGDLVFVKQQSSARNGDIVVALIEGEATVKFFFHENNRIRLQPAHPTMAPIYVDETQEASVQGIVVGVFRRY